MPSHRHLAAAHQQTLERIFAHGHPALEWPDLLHLVEEVGHVEPEGHEEYRLVVNGERHKVKRPHHDQLTNPDELAAIRALFERARITP